MVKMSILLLLVTSFVYNEKIVAQESNGSINKLTKKDDLPVPKEKGQLFYLQRDPNSNTVIYTLNMEDDGELDESNPINAHWIRYAENGAKSDLSFIQRKMAYGVHHTKIGDNEFDIRIQAYKELPIRLRFNKQKDKYQAFTKVDQKEIVLESIFVRIDGGSVFNPNIKYIEITGHDPGSKSKISHRFQP